jgi:hypothetical protein
MKPKFEVGQQVTVQMADSQSGPLRDHTLEQYLNKSGQIIKYYWISPGPGEIFYIYSVRFLDTGKEIVLHEDEIKPAIK